MREEIAARVRRGGRRALVLTREHLAVLDLLEGRGIEALPFKGPLQTRRLYGDPALRWSTDLDLFVHPDRLDEAVAALRERGYSMEHASPPGLGGLLHRHGCHHRMSRRSPPVDLEVHWRYPAGVRGVDAGVDSMMRRGLFRRLGGVRFRDLPTTDLLLLLTLHGFWHRWGAVKWIADVDRILVRESDAVDWSRLLDRAGALGCGSIVLTGLWVAHRAVGAPLPGEVEERCAADPRARRLARAHLAALFDGEEERMGTVGRAFEWARARDRPGQRLGSALRVLLQPRTADAALPAAGRAPVPLLACARLFRLAAVHGVLRPVRRVVCRLPAPLLRRQTPPASERGADVVAGSSVGGAALPREPELDSP